MGKGLTLLFVVVLICAIAGAYLFYRATSSTTQKTEVRTSEYVPPAIMKRDGEDYYQRLIYKFGLHYPENLTVTEHNEVSNSTIVFEDSESGASFQIFIASYAEQDISEERFKMDVPTGVIENLREIEVDGVRAVEFESIDMEVGETTEIWFINNGFLYEVTTYRELSGWLRDILEDWQFLEI